jgi:hypothetical protein
MMIFVVVSLSRSLSDFLSPPPPSRALRQMISRRKFGEILVRDAENMKLKNSTLGARFALRYNGRERERERAQKTKLHSGGLGAR